MKKLSAIEFMQLAQQARSLIDSAINKLDKARAAHENVSTKKAA